MWANDQCDASSFDIHCPSTLITQISSIPILSTQKDHIYIKKGGCNSLSHTINLSINPNQPKKLYKHIWIHLYKPSVSFFLWRLSLKLLPIDDILKLKGLRLASICHFCKESDENMMHLFFRCPFVVKVWLDVDNEFGTSFSGSLNHSFTALLSLWLPYKTKWIGLIFGYCLWLIWFSRNKLKHEGDLPQVRLITVSIKRYLSYIKYMNWGDNTLARFIPDCGNLCSVGLLEQWICPLPGWIKLNIAGFFDSILHAAGIGMVVRNFMGKCTLYLSTSCAVYSEFYSSLIALVFAASITKWVGFSCIIIEMEDENLLSIFKSNTDPPWKYTYICRLVRSLLAGCHVSWELCSKLCNRPANFLAQAGSEIEDLLIDNDPPQGLAWLLFGDTYKFHSVA